MTMRLRQRVIVAGRSIMKLASSRCSWRFRLSTSRSRGTTARAFSGSRLMNAEMASRSISSDIVFRSEARKLPVQLAVQVVHLKVARDDRARLFGLPVDERRNGIPQHLERHRRHARKVD